MSLVVDASVAVKFITEEAGSAEAYEIIVGPESLIAPDWVQIEVASALWKKVKFSRLLEIHAVRALEDLPAFFTQLMPTPPLLAAAFALSLRLRHAVYDCLYLALAINEDSLVITADRAFRQAADRAGLGDRIQLLEFDS